MGKPFKILIAKLPLEAQQRVKERTEAMLQELDRQELGCEVPRPEEDSEDVKRGTS